MKILILNHNQEGLGTYWRCFFFSQELAKLRNQVIMICASGKKFDLWIRKKKINKNFTIITLPRICYHKYFTGQALLRLPLTCLLVFILKYDLVYAFAVAQPQIAIPAVLAKILRKKRLIIDWDDVWGKGLGIVHGQVIDTIFTYFERKTLVSADKITYVSEWIGKEIKSLGLINKAKKIPNGADAGKIKVIKQGLAIKRLKLDPSKKYLLSMGNTYSESLEFLLKSFKIVAQKNKNIILLLLGSAKIPFELKPLLGKQVKILGVRPYSEMSLYLSSADVLVLPMAESVFEKARFPVRLGDYLCAKKIIVSNAIGEVKYFLKKYDCAFVTKSSQNELANTILKVIKDPKLGAKKAIRARQLAETALSWQRIVQNLEKWIKE